MGLIKSTSIYVKLTTYKEGRRRKLERGSDGGPGHTQRKADKKKNREAGPHLRVMEKFG